MTRTTDPAAAWATGPERPREDHGFLDVWVADLGPAAHDATVLGALLDADEAARARRFVRDEDRRRWTVSRGLLRILLGLHLDVDPSAVRFCYGTEGKPSLDGPHPLRFNLSHAGDLALMAVTSGVDVGVDVERVRPLPELDGVAQRFFSEAEVRELRALPREVTHDAFYRGWTRKEAVLKATGRGLSGDSRAFDVTLDPGTPARLLHASGDVAPPASWSLFHLDPAQGAVGAVAAPSPGMQLRRWRVPDGLAPKRV